MVGDLVVRAHPFEETCFLVFRLILLLLVHSLNLLAQQCPSVALDRPAILCKHVQHQELHQVPGQSLHDREHNHGYLHSQLSVRLVLHIRTVEMGLINRGQREEHDVKGGGDHKKEPMQQHQSLIAEDPLYLGLERVQSFEGKTESDSE